MYHSIHDQRICSRKIVVRLPVLRHETDILRIRIRIQPIFHPCYIRSITNKRLIRLVNHASIKTDKTLLFLHVVSRDGTKLIEFSIFQS